MSDEKKHSFLFILTVTVMVITIFSWAIWVAFKHDIMNLIRWLCVAELYGIDVFVNDKYITEYKEILPKLNKEELNMEIIKNSLMLVGGYMKFVFIPILLGIFYQVFMHQPLKMFRNKMGLQEMIKFQAEAWPYIKPFVEYDPGKESTRSLGDKVPKKLPVFAEALAPEEWLVYNDINIDPKEYIFDEEKAKKIFQKQLGDRWRGISKLPLYQRALIVAFALKVDRQREKSDALLGELSKCWSRKSGFVIDRKTSIEINKILKNSKIIQQAIDVANCHAYVNSAILGILDWARVRGGVLAPSQFVWLRGVDRDLWYALNSLGRKTYFSEGAGSIAHYYTEKAVGKPLVTINVDNAIQSIKDYMEEFYPEIPNKE